MKTLSRPKTKNIPSRIFLGIDPGTTRIGYGLIQESAGGLRCLDYGIISNPGKIQTDDLSSTYTAVGELIAKYSPSATAVERLFFTNNQKTAMPVGEMRGVILLALTHAQMPLYEFTPLQVKQRICNYGFADKSQVQKMVRNILKLSSPIKPDDAADALALAICCASSHT